MCEFKNFGNVGYYKDADNLITFQLGDTDPLATAWPGSMNMDQFKAVQPSVMKIQDKYVLSKGISNRLTEEIEHVLKMNRFMPELIEKQIRMLYGSGPAAYIERFNNGILTREWQQNPIIENWFNNWQEKGLQDDIKEYCQKVIRDYYYFEDFWTKWRFQESRKLYSNGSVVGLEHIKNKDCRLCSDQDLTEYGNDFEDKDFSYVIKGDWISGITKEFKIYPRFRMHTAFDNLVSVSYHKNNTVGQIYGFNHYYPGLRDWLIGTNKNPQYIKAYLENSLNAKIHLIIPDAWIKNVENKLQKSCQENIKLQEDNKDLLKPLGINIGTEYNTTFLDQYIAKEIEKMTSFLSGVSNQGKMLASIGYNTSEGQEISWRLNSVDQKYREFISALIDYDNRADNVITMGVGMDQSLSGVDSGGIFKDPGGTLVYNFMIYLENLPLAESTCTQALNWALKVNFPALFKEGYRIGFFNKVLESNEKLSENFRLQY